MGMYNQIVEVESNVVKITTGGLEKEYNKTDLKCSATDIMVFLYYYTDSKNQIVASWNAYQADLYGYTLSSLKSYIDGLLSSSKANLSNINLGSVGEFATQADAIAGGLKNGDVYRLPKNADNRMLAIVNAIIESYTAGTSTIDFTNNGGDDWTVGFKIAVSDLPSGWSVTSYDYNVTLSKGGVDTPIESGTKTADYDVTSNLSGNGAGVYSLSCQYNMTDGINNLYILIGSLIKVDASGNVLGAIKNDGLKANSVNGLNIDYTAYVTQIGVSEIINVDAMDANTHALTNLSHSLNDTVTLPIGTGGVWVYTDLDNTFWADLGSLLSNPFTLGNLYLTVIS